MYMTIFHVCVCCCVATLFNKSVKHFVCTVMLQDHLLKQGNVEQSPVSFLNQETPDSRLLVVIKNKDIAGHVHKVFTSKNLYNPAMRQRK